MAVDLVFRGGPTSLFAVSGSNNTDSISLTFKGRPIFNSVFIGVIRKVSMLNGRLSFTPIYQSTTLWPSGKNLEGPRIESNETGDKFVQLFPKQHKTR